MKKNSKRLLGWGGPALGLILLALFNENAASFFEDTGLNRGWRFIEPGTVVLASAIRLLGHPVMTHIYAFIAGVAACLGAVVLAVRANAETPKADKLIPLRDVVAYLREGSAWGQSKGNVSDQAIQFELIDALSQSRLYAFARPWDDYGHATPITRVSTNYFGGVVIDMDAIRRGDNEQIRLKPGHYGDRFNHWTFPRSQVESIWPKR